MSLLKRIVQSTPIPISDVMFSFSALDTLFQSLQRIFRRSLEAGCMLCREGGAYCAEAFAGSRIRYDGLFA